MKKKVELRLTNESCVTMNIPRKSEQGNDGIKDKNKDAENIRPKAQSPSASSSYVQTEVGLGQTDDIAENCGSSNDRQLSPPLASLGPGAEIKGKICHPIQNKLENEESQDENAKIPPGVSGGRLTFFKEGRPLLELSHRSDQGAWVQVKSKTYWPPPSTATTTATQHPLSHDAPTTHSVSDDCSSVNLSPWSSDHVRKQSGPNPSNRITLCSEELFYIRTSPFVRKIRRMVALRSRNPYVAIEWPFWGEKVKAEELETSAKSAHLKDIMYNERKQRLEGKIEALAEKCSYKVDNKISILSLFEKVDAANSDNADPTFISPRKRYLRSLESEAESHIRKRVHSSLNSSNFKHCDRATSSPSQTTPHKSAISSTISSPYSIDSLLSSETESKKVDSFLKTLLKPEKKQQPFLHAKSDSSRSNEIPNHVKYETGSPYHYQKEKRDNPGRDHKRAIPDLLEIGPATPDFSQYSSAPNLSGLYLNPYFDPRFMMFHSLSSTTPFLPNAPQPSDMAVAAVAAAAAGYPFSPLHLPSALGGPLLPPSPLHPHYPPPSSLASHIIHSPPPTYSPSLHMTQSNPKPPLVHIPHSPKPSTIPSSALPSHHHLERVSSPRDIIWPPHNSSPLKLTSNSSLSVPPQDVPLNLSKNQGKS